MYGYILLCGFNGNKSLSSLSEGNKSILRRNLTLK